MADSVQLRNHATVPGWVPTAESDVQSVQLQLERILEHPYFCKSRRCTSLLRYIVEKTLSAECELKERTLGIEIFGRPPDYETNTDPIVRNTAHDVRKRLAQYYCEPGHEHELRIDLPPGSYVPHIYQPEISFARNEESERSAPPANSLASLRAAPRRTGWLAYALLALLCIGATTTVAALRPWQTPTAEDKFWAPILKHADTTVVVSVGEPVIYALQNGIGTPSPREKLPPWNVIGMNDILVFAKVTSYLGLQGKVAHVQGQSATTLDDLKNGPTVFIGAFDNKWSIALSQDLYYRLKPNPSPQISGSIYDSSIGREWTYTPHVQDYAIVARFQDPATHQFVMIGAGIGEPGNSAAGDFITNPELLEAAIKSSGRDWSHGNVELVLSTKVTSGVIGPPEVVATHFW